LQLKVLLADQNDERAEALARHLCDASVGEVARVADGERLFEAVKRCKPDVVIVDMARADRDGLDAIREVTAHDPKPIVMFSDSGDRTFMDEAISAGVSSYNVRGAALPDVKPIVQAAVAIFRRYQKMADELQAAEAKLDEQAIVLKAKNLLMRERAISEPNAYKWLRRRAMDQGKRIADVARELLASRPQNLR